MILEAIATLAAGIFGGAALYINVAEHPARMECGTAVATTVFAPSYRRAALMQASLAGVGLLAGVGAWLQGGEIWWLAAGLILGSVIPFTFLAIMPTNKQLLATGLNKESAEAATLLRRWGQLHAVRTVLGLIAFGVFVWRLVT
ncbi:MAG: DUF1772 domain-containing protein [bacterium]|nr:DUF1772 domain-containing protein [bacterium]